MILLVNGEPLRVERVNVKTVNAVVEMLISKLTDRIYNTASVIHISKKDNLQKNI